MREKPGGQERWLGVRAGIDGRKKKRKGGSRSSRRERVSFGPGPLHEWTNNELNAIRPRQYALSVRTRAGTGVRMKYCNSFGAPGLLGRMHYPFRIAR